MSTDVRLSVLIKQEENKELLFEAPYIDVYPYCLEIQSDIMRNVYKGCRLTVIYFTGIKDMAFDDNASINILFRNGHVLKMMNVDQTLKDDILRRYNAFKNKHLNIFQCSYIIMQTIDEECSTIKIFMDKGSCYVKENIPHQDAYKIIKDHDYYYENIHMKKL